MKKKAKTALICGSCGWVGVSWHVHDFQMCPCKNEAFIDGGDEYGRYGAMNLDMLRIGKLVQIKPLQ